jgi:hypothetical protein
MRARLIHVARHDGHWRLGCQVLKAVTKAS